MDVYINIYNRGLIYYNKVELFPLKIGEILFLFLYYIMFLNYYSFLYLGL